MKRYVFVTRIHFILDFLTIFKHLSLHFQKENLLLSQTKYHVESTLNILKEMRNTPQ
jgi:hypothetical protein